MDKHSQIGYWMREPGDGQQGCAAKVPDKSLVVDSSRHEDDLKSLIFRQKFLQFQKQEVAVN